MQYYYAVNPGGQSLSHYGVLGMKCGVRRYQNKDGSLTAAGKKRQAINEGRSIRKSFGKDQRSSKRLSRTESMKTASQAWKEKRQSISDAKAEARKQKREQKFTKDDAIRTAKMKASYDKRGYDAAVAHEIGKAKIQKLALGATAVAATAATSKIGMDWFAHTHILETAYDQTIHSFGEDYSKDNKWTRTNLAKTYRSATEYRPSDKLVDNEQYAFKPIKTTPNYGKGETHRVDLMKTKSEYLAPVTWKNNGTAIDVGEPLSKKQADFRYNTYKYGVPGAAGAAIYGYGSNKINQKRDANIAKLAEIDKQRKKKQ